MANFTQVLYENVDYQEAACRGGNSVLAFWDYESRDNIPPVIANFLPVAGSSLDADEAFTFQVTDQLALLTVNIAILYDDDLSYEVVHDGTAFSDAYILGSTRTPISNGYAYSIKRTALWKGPFTVSVFAYDTAGNDATDSVGYIAPPEIVTIYVNRVWNTTTNAMVRWSTGAPDPSGAEYPGPGVFGVDTQSPATVESIFQ